MLPLNLSRDPAAPLQVLCLGAHSDDIEIGCGGTILQLLSGYSNVDVRWIVFSSNAERERIVGRDAEAGFVVSRSSVSRQHARLYVDDVNWWVEDLNSTNGTFVNEVRIKAQQLNDGDQVRFGDAIYKFLAGSNIDVKPRAGGVGNPLLVAKNETPLGLSALAYALTAYSVGALQGGVLRTPKWFTPVIGALRLAAPLGVPVLGVNLGRVGYLTEVDGERLPDALQALADGGLRDHAEGEPKCRAGEKCSPENARGA